MKGNFWFMLGLSTFSIVLGILIGASQSPVLGIAFTSIFGLAGIIAGIIFGNKERKTHAAANNLDISLVGLSLTAFSLFLLSGVYLGANYRVKMSGFSTGPKDFIWDADNPPATLDEALDWIVADEILLEKGYKKDQIRYLYDLSRKKQASDENSNVVRAFNSQDTASATRRPITALKKLKNLRTAAPALPLSKPPLTNDTKADSVAYKSNERISPVDTSLTSTDNRKDTSKKRSFLQRLFKRKNRVH